MNHEYIKILGTRSNDVSDINSREITLAVKGMLPVFEKDGEDRKNITGGVRATRNKILKVKVEFVTLIVDAEDEINDYSSYLDLLKLLEDFEYIWFKETDLFRVGLEGENLWTTILPMTFEMIEGELSPLFEEGSDSMTTTWQSREAVTIGGWYD